MSDVSVVAIPLLLELLSVCPIGDSFDEYEVDWDWGQGVVSHALGRDPYPDYFEVEILGARRLFRWRGKYPKQDRWSGWFYVYAPSVIMVPEEL